MKATNNGYYTDPIVYEEGFFKDKKDELKFLKKIEIQLKKGTFFKKKEA